MKRKVSQATVHRLSLYTRYLGELEAREVDYISSDKLGEGIGTNAAQVRKDLSIFDRFGIPGRGYPVSFLRKRLAKILGVEDRVWRVAVVGAGCLGTALVCYSRFEKQGFHFVAILDNDSAKIGTRIGKLEVADISDLERIIRSEKVEVAVISVPVQNAQQVTDLMVEAGVRAFLNFAPVNLNVPPHIVLRNVDLTVEFEGLSFHLINH
ncbi:redox-sensing transcriptional repressor Rex [bacterium]|nr:redox-sensing transcriptional repressor Rex [bacterium]